MNIVVSHNLIVPKYMINVNRKGSKNPKARAWVGGARKRISPKNPSAEKFWGRGPSRRAKMKGVGGNSEQAALRADQYFCLRTRFRFLAGNYIRSYNLFLVGEFEGGENLN